MADTITVKQGDYGVSATLAFVVTDPDLTITTLAGYTVYLLVWGTDKANPIINGLCTFDSLLTCHYVPVAADFATSGNYSWELECNAASDRLSTETGIFIITPSATHS